MTSRMPSKMKMNVLSKMIAKMNVKVEANKMMIV
jgi:hypothetical protein